MAPASMSPASPTGPLARARFGLAGRIMTKRARHYFASPAEFAPHVLAAKRRVVVIAHLRQGPMRFSELGREPDDRERYAKVARGEGSQPRHR